MNEIVDALTWCHSNGVALVDLKPSNLMLKGGGWELIDFEGSRIIGQECVGVIIPRYCAPGG